MWCGRFRDWENMSCLSCLKNGACIVVTSKLIVWAVQRYAYKSFVAMQATVNIININVGAALRYIHAMNVSMNTQNMHACAPGPYTLSL